MARLSAAWGLLLPSWSRPGAPVSAPSALRVRQAATWPHSPRFELLKLLAHFAQLQLQAGALLSH
jgi:hypothetical protein